MNAAAALPKVSRAAAVREGEVLLAAAGVENPRLDARLLLTAAAEIEREDLLRDPEQDVPAAALKRYRAYLSRRSAREPVSRILSRREFWSLEFRVGPSTLDPRADSETLVESVLAAIASTDSALEILDLGTGTGCLLLALLSELRQAHGLGVDNSPEALETARLNAASLDLGTRAEFRLGDWCEGLDKRFDIVVCNPPYIESGALQALEPEVRDYDPPVALDGGPDGLSSYRRLARDLPSRLKPGGLAALEIGAGQAAAVCALFATAGFEPFEQRCDLAGQLRCLVFTRGRALTG